MTTAEYLATPSADPKLAWINRVLAKTKFAPEFLAADITVRYEKTKGVPYDTYVDIASAKPVHLYGGHCCGDTDGTKVSFKDARKAFQAAVAPAEETAPAPAPEAVKEDTPAEAPVGEAAAPAKPKRARKAKAPKAKPADTVPEAEAFDAETVERALKSVFG